MAGVATAYLTDALTSSEVTDNEKWEFAVPISADVGFLRWISPFLILSEAVNCSRTSLSSRGQRVEVLRTKQG